MFLTAKPNNSMSRAEDYALAPPTGFVENVDAAYDATVKGDAVYALEVAMSDKYNAISRDLYNRTGQSLPDITYAEYNAIAEAYSGDFADPEMTIYDQTRRGPRPNMKMSFADFERNHAKLAAEYGIPNLNEIWESVREEAQRADEEFGRIAARSGVAGTLGALTGGIGGSMTVRGDPLNVFTLPLGGWGKTIAGRIATEGAVQMGIEGANQIFNQRSRELLGLDNSVERQLMNVAFAGAGGAAVRGAFEGLGVGLRKLANVGDRETGGEFSRKVAESLPDDKPSNRAAKHAASQERIVNDANLFGDDLIGRAAHNVFLEDAINVIVQGTRAKIMSLPLPRGENLWKEYNTEVAFEQAAKTFGPRDPVPELQDIKIQIADIDANIQAARQGDIAAIIDDANFKAEVADLQSELQRIKAQKPSRTESTNQRRQERIAEIENQLNETRGNMLDLMSAQRRELRKQEKIKEGEARLFEAQQGRREAERLQRVAAALPQDPPSYAEMATKPVAPYNAKDLPMIWPSGMTRYSFGDRDELVQQAIRAITESEDIFEANNEKMIDRIRKSINEEDNTVDLGDGGRIDLDQPVIIDAEDGKTVTMTVRQMLDAREDYKAMEEVAGSCGI